MKHAFTIGAGWVHRFYRTLVDWGVTKEAIFSASGIREEDLINYDDRVPVALYTMLGRMAHRLTNTPEIGLVLGQRADFHNMGVVFQLASNCSVVRESLVYATRYSNLGNEAVREEFEQGEKLAEWSAQYVCASFMTASLIEFDCCQKVRILKNVIGRDFKPVQFKFQCAPPRYVDKYHEVFQAPLLFNQDKSAMIFNVAHLDHPNPNPQPYLKALLDRHARSLSKKLEKNRYFQENVRRIIIRQLHTGSVCLDSIARALNVSSRTVYRKLKEEHTSYKELMDDVQKELAESYLKEVSFSIDEISLLLGFSEASAFQRAFKRWFGTPPGQYRQRMARRVERTGRGVQSKPPQCTA